ncbi:MAG: hypothetical protein PWP45_1619, partial [Tepidanaerobacteraceae bacterium]|nr:hypothetical protein [Tepidanaerobacteraceae bacterium]
PSEGKSNIRKGGESLVRGPTWLKIKTVKFFEPGSVVGKKGGIEEITEGKRAP